MESKLFLITARGGSKGVPGKNTKILGSKPLVQYSIEFARTLTSDDHICISTDDLSIIQLAENLGLKAPFVRPAKLATDTSSSRDVIIHALDYFQEKGKTYDTVVLLQPTSPFRKTEHFNQMNAVYRPGIDMAVSVEECSLNPYYSLFEENKDGFLQPSKTGSYTRRQDAPSIYAFNGSIYIIRSASIRAKPISEFTRIKKFVMDKVHSIDIDTAYDWIFAESILSHGLWSGY